MNSSLHIEEAALAHNYRTLQAAAGRQTEVLAVIKANAYGHGAELCAPMLVRAGARWLGVTSAAEGARVRSALAGAAADILIMCGLLPGDAAMTVEHGLTPVIWTPEHVAWLAGTGARVHVEVDTGMSRQGVEPGPALAALLQQIEKAGLQLDGIFTHYCSAEDAGSALTALQQQRFTEAIAQVRDAGARPAWVHAGNSSSVDNPAAPEAWLTGLAATVNARAMVRTGLALYGYCLPISPADAASAQVAAQLRPVLTWRTRVLSCRSLAPGESVGYNATFTAAAPMQIALLPVGYADGLRRELSATSARGESPAKAGGYVMLNGRRANILGRISMNLTVVEITGHETVQPGDEAIVLGPGITADNHARLAGTIAYEILCGLHPCG